MQHKRIIIIGAALVAAAGLTGGAYAATQSSSPRQAYLNDVAKRLNVSPQALSSAMKNALDDQLNAAVKAGSLTQAQANAIKQRIQQGGPGGAFRSGPGGISGGSGPSGFASAGIGAVASYLGVSQSDLLSDLRSGKTLAQVADSQGKSISGLKAEITSAVTSDLDKAVSQNQITSAQRTQILNALSANIDALVNGTAHGPGPFGGFGGAFGAAAGSAGSPSPGAASPYGYGRPPAGLFPGA
jgi:hypothetical protein